MDLKAIKNLIQIVSKSKISELNVKIGNLEVYIKQNPIKSLDSNQVLSNNIDTDISLLKKYDKLEIEQKQYNESNYVIIKSPMIGTFYSRPSPDKDPYVKIGDNIEPGVKLCIIEAMKLFNDIEAEISGKIIKILVDDTSPVEYDQPLFLVDPS